MKQTSGATYRVITDSPALLTLQLIGRFDHASTAGVWNDLVTMCRQSTRHVLRIDGSGVTYMDGSGTALLLFIKELQVRHGAFELAGLPEKFSQQFAQLEQKTLIKQGKDKEPQNSVEMLGGAVAAGLAKKRSQISFVGELIAAAGYVFHHPKTVRVSDILRNARQIGYEGLPIVVLIGFLMGLIMSFQSAVTLQRFGAEIFVANMLGIAMFREMGPLVTAILLAGRSGSAFAAEIGTMKVNEELDALTTMGLSPVSFLVLPKIIATMFMMPLLTMFFNFASLVGGAVVMLSMGYPLTTFTSRVFSAVQMGDYLTGMSKAMVFALLVSAVGCLRGIQTKSGAGAVGESTTGAVVGGIVAIAVADGFFAVACYYLGI